MPLQMRHKPSRGPRSITPMLGRSGRSVGRGGAGYSVSEPAGSKYRMPRHVYTIGDTIRLEVSFLSEHARVTPLRLDVR